MLQVKKLFNEPDDAARGPVDATVVGVAVNANVWRMFDYLWPAGLGTPELGQRIRVPFGRSGRKTLAFIAETDRPPSDRPLKTVVEIIDPTAQLDETLWKLGQWMGHYYLTPLGMALAAMVPSAVGRHRPRSETVVYLVGSRRDWSSSLGSRQRRVLDELYEARKQGIEPLTLEGLLHHSGCSRDSVKRLVARKLLRTESRPVRLAELSDQMRDDPFELNNDQKSVLAAFEKRIGQGFSATLLHGVTGSGKTEVYIRAIRSVISAGGQAILMVPDIALATQTTQRLLDRLPRVAVLHSGLTDAQRAFNYQQIRDGHADVIVGPRSAVFAPARKLGLIVVDEEHESSYKQDTAPPYHGRDVAIMRAQLASVPILLGSATPSLESTHNVQIGRYHLLRLPKRISKRGMPKLQIVHLRKEMTPGRIELIGRTLTHKMAGVLDRGEQVILLMNRRGYASYVCCPKCGWTMQCDNCTRGMVFHQATQMVMCHYCQHTASLPEHCPACDGKLLLFGLGIQRIENELSRKFPSARVARMDSDTMTSPKQFRKVFEQFSSGDLDILLGTQMVAKGLDFPHVSLVGIASADTSLTIPDFRASERTFQLIVQVAGRAGRAEVPGEVVVQTLYADEPAIRFATEHDYDGFAGWELPLRRQAGMPPYGRIVRFLIRHENIDRAEAGAGVLAGELRRLLHNKGVKMFGPQPAGVRKIRGQFRFQILVIVSQAGLVQREIRPHMERLSRSNPAEVVADADPINLM